MTIRRTLQHHALIIGAIILVAGLIAASDTLHDKSGEIIVWTEALISRYPTLGILAFVLLSMASAMLAFFSAAVFTPIAVYTWGSTTCLVLLWIGWLLGGLAAYCIGHFLGQSVAARLVGEQKLAAWQQQLRGRTKFIHVLLFQTALPSEIPGYVLGILHFRFGYFLPALAISELPYAVATVYLGESFLKGESLIFIILGSGAILAGGFIYRLYRHVALQE